jgi:hypothetical protein
MSTADTLAGAGLSYPQAIEIARQMAAGAPSGGDVNKLMAVGIPGMQATELARQINAGAFSAHLLARSMWAPELARVIKTASGL